MVDGAHAADDAAVLDRLADVARRQNTAENFPVALRLLPSQPRDRLLRVYTYARFVDDVGDEAAGDRLALLDLVEADVRRLRDGSPQLAPVAALVPVVRDAGVPMQPFLDLVEANRRDQHVSSYETFDDLLDYCRLSAAPVGRIVLGLAGVRGADETHWSDSICNALQVLEHCQDVAEDARAGRVYLPAVELRAAGISDDDLVGERTSPSLRRVVARQVARARVLLADGRPLLRNLHGWSRVAVTGYVAGGYATAKALEAADYDVVSRQVRASKWRTLLTATRLTAGLVRP